MTPAIGSPWKKRLFPQKLRCVFVWRRYILLLFLAANLHFWQGELFTCPKTFWHLFPQEGRTTTKWNYFLNYCETFPLKGIQFWQVWKFGCLFTPRTNCHFDIQDQRNFQWLHECFLFSLADFQNISEVHMRLFLFYLIR